MASRAQEGGGLRFTTKRWIKRTRLSSILSTSIDSGTRMCCCDLSTKYIESARGEEVYLPACGRAVDGFIGF